ncbi:uncharacterized protein TNCV_2852921 [Trichonephila clavipes]|uniref:Uncharacterized protein n=1 Tax=Trichonephila clavipes TaxID=2585209 RepID=A0A8X6RGD0_TRICX|nr:uncharacterized protein TNCV_2852921 [Trichonephila clavipes]
MPSTDQSSRRPSHRKKGTRTANCFIGRHPHTGSSFSRAPVSSRTIRAWLKDIWTRGECLNPAFALQRHIAPTAGVMIWGAIAYNIRSHLVLIRGIMTACNHMCCPSCNGSQEPFFNKTMLGLTRQGCHKTVSALLQPFLVLLDPQICLQSSISGTIWDGKLGIPRV